MNLICVHQSYSKMKNLVSYSLSISSVEYVHFWLLINEFIFFITFITFLIFKSKMWFNIFFMSVSSLSFMSSFHVFIDNPLLGWFIKFSGILSIIITLLISLPNRFRSLIKQVTTWHIYSCGMTSDVYRAYTLWIRSKGR